MVREATKSPRITVKELKAFVASWGHQVSKSRRHLHNHGLFRRVARRKPFLTPRHRRKRVEFAKRHLNYDWKKVLFKGLVRYSISMFGVETEMHTRRVAGLQSNGKPVG